MTHPAPFRAVLTASIFARVAKIAAHGGKYRDYLKLVRVEPHPDGGAILIALSGPLAVCLRDEDATVSRAASVRIDAPLTARMIDGTETLVITERRAALVHTGEPCAFGGTDPAAALDDPSITMTTTDGEPALVLALQLNPPVDAGDTTLAAWRLYFAGTPDLASPVRETFNPRGLRHVARAFGTPGLHLYPTVAGSGGPDRAHWALPREPFAGVTGAAVVMPIKYNTPLPALPEWWGAAMGAKAEGA